MTDIEKITQFINEAEEFVKMHVTYSMPEFSAWHSKVERYLTNKYGQESVELKNFRKRPFRPMSLIVGEPHDNSIECIKDLKTTILELKNYLAEESENSGQVAEVFTNKVIANNRIFIVHGHDGELKEALARLIESQDLQAIILNKKANQGRTLIEKLENNSDVGAAIALFTNDDFGRAKDSKEDMPRARQNVVFEAGYFMGKFGRDHIVIIAEEGVELPSDLQGIVYTDKSNWELDVCRDLKAMGYNIDLNKLL